MGSDSDLPVVQKAADQLRALDIPFEVHVYSAHRTPEQAREFAVSAAENGFGAIIAVSDAALQEKLIALRREASAKVLEKDREISARL